MAVNINNFQPDPEQFIIVPPTSVTIATQTIVDNSLNLKLFGFAVANITGSAVKVTITDGNGNKVLDDASFDAHTTQFVETAPGFYLMNGVKASSDTDNGAILWVQVKKM